MTKKKTDGIVKYVAPALLLLLLGAVWVVLTSGDRDAAPLPEIGVVPAFSLRDETGSAVNESLFTGKVSVVDFIFTSCAGICPLMSGRMAWLQEELRDRADVRFVSFSVDPETDTPEVLTEYGKRYGAIPGRWTFLTGDRKQIYEMTKNGFHLGLEAEGDNAIIHSQKFVLVDRKGSIRGYYDSDSTDAMDLLLEQVVSLSEDPAQ